MKALRFVLMGIALAALLALGLRLGLRDGVRPAPAPAPVAVRLPAPAPPVQTPAAPVASQPHQPDAADARATVLSRLADAPDYAPFFERLRGEFPSEYVSLVDGATKTVREGGHAPNPDRLLTDAVRGLRQSRGVLAAQAEPLPLAGVFEAQAAVLDALAATDPTTCVDFLYGGMSPSFMAFAATHRELIERLAIANLTAIANGQRSKIERNQPTSDDFDSLTAALKTQNLSDDEIAALLDGKTFDPPLPEKRLCEAGRTYLHVLDGLPEDAKTRIYALSATLLARS